MVGWMGSHKIRWWKQQDRDENRCYSTYVFLAKHGEEKTPDNRLENCLPCSVVIKAMRIIVGKTCCCLCFLMVVDGWIDWVCRRPPDHPIDRACDARALFGRSVDAVDAESAAVAAARSTADMKERGATL